MRSEWGTFQIAAIASFALATGACAPSSLWGEPANDPAMHSYRKVNASCAQMDLSQSRLDVNSAKKLVACLDSQGGLGGFGKLVHAMSPDELGPFVEGLNRSFLDNPENLYQSERIFTDLKARTELDQALSGLGTLLQEDELLARSVALFRESFAPQGQVDPALLAALGRLSRELTEDHAADALDLALLASDARAFGSLWDRLSDSRPLPPSVAEGLVAYGRSGSKLGHTLVDRLIDGSMFRFVDAVVPDDQAGLAAQVPRWSSVLGQSLGAQGRIAGQLGRLFSALGQPIPCMQGARALRYSPLDVIGELVARPTAEARSFIERDKLSELYLSYPLCSFPAEVAPGYRALVELAGTPAIEPMTDLLRSAYGVQSGTARPVAEFLVQALADPGFQKLLPALSELQERGAWDDLLLLATLPRFRDRSKIVDLLKVLVEPLPGAPAIGGQPATILDVLVQGFARVEPEELTAWFASFRATDAGLAAALRGVRAAYVVNDAHPLLGLLRDWMASAPENPALLEAMLKVSARPEFQESLRELSRMAADGRLRDLLSTTLTLFDRYAARGKSVVHALPPGAPAPGLRFGARHFLRSADLKAWSPSGAQSDFGSCARIDFSIPWNQLGAPGFPEFEEQFLALSACVNSDGKYPELADSLRLLTTTQTDPASDGTPPESIHALLVQAYDTFSFTKSEASLMADWALVAVRDGRVGRALQALPILVHRSVIRPLVDFAGPLIGDVQARLGLRRLGVYGASVLRRDDVQQVLAYADDLYNAHPAPPPPVARASYDRDRILRWIANKECTSLPADPAATEAYKSQRLSAVLDEFESSVVNDGPLTGGKLRTSWSTAELKSELDPILKKFADIPGNGPLARALLRFTARFGDPAQFPPGYLEQWLRKRANDRRIVAYIYPGETLPRVRLLNGLDRLAVILLNADLDAGDPIGNFGMQFLASISEAWGDVPFEKRPPEIQAKYPKDKHCPTLAEAINDIASTAQGFIQMVGLPPLPQCQQVADPNDPVAVQQAETTDPVRPPPSDDNPYLPDPDPGTPEAKQRAVLQGNLYNIAETVSVLKENVADGGMSVLRDLFFDLYYTGPAAHQDPDAGLKNNLSVATRLVRVGLLRQIGRLIADTPADDPVIHGFFRALIDGAARPETGPALEALFGALPGQDVIWGVIDQVIQLQSSSDIATAKGIGLYGLSALDSLGHARAGSDFQGNELLGPLMLALQPILSQDSALLARHVDLVGELLTWRDGADLLHALAIDRSPVRSDATSLVLDAVSDTRRGLDLMAMLGALDASPQAHQSWDDFRDRWRALDGVPEYRALKLSELGRQLLFFLEARTSDGKAPLPAEQAALTRKLLLTTATLLERGDMQLVDQLLAFARKDPDGFYRVIESLSGLVEQGDVQALLDLIDSKLGPAA